MIARNKPCYKFSKKIYKGGISQEFNEMYNCGIPCMKTRSLVKNKFLRTNIYEWWNSDDINFKKNILPQNLLIHQLTIISQRVREVEKLRQIRNLLVKNLLT